MRPHQKRENHSRKGSGVKDFLMGFFSGIVVAGVAAIWHFLRETTL